MLIAFKIFIFPSPSGGYSVFLILITVITNILLISLKFSTPSEISSATNYRTSFIIFFSSLIYNFDLNR